MGNKPRIPTLVSKPRYDFDPRRRLDMDPERSSMFFYSIASGLELHVDLQEPTRSPL